MKLQCLKEDVLVNGRGIAWGGGRRRWRGRGREGVNVDDDDGEFRNDSAKVVMEGNFSRWNVS